MKNSKVPILFIIFNRLGYAQKVFNEIKKYKPQKLYVASDAHRPSVDGEKEKIEELRNWVLGNVDWDCEVKTLFQENNIGCPGGVVAGINWFFQNEREGIIFEEDCVPNQSLFRFHEVLLERYRNNKNIGCITGYNYLGKVDLEESYFLAKHVHLWGWSTWADRWNDNYDITLKSWDKKNLDLFSSKKRVREFMGRVLKAMQSEKTRTSWDWQFVFALLAKNMLNIYPSMNMITNIGVAGGQHCNVRDEYGFLNTKTYEMDEIRHPDKAEFNEELQECIYDKFIPPHKKYLFPYSDIEKNSQIIIYGAGGVGLQYLEEIEKSGYCRCLFVVDKNYKNKTNVYGLEVRAPEQLKVCEYDKVLVASEYYTDEMYNHLIELGIPAEKIVRQVDFAVEEL